MEMIAMDSHKRYTVATVQKPSGERLMERRIEHTRGAVMEFLAPWTVGSPVAVESIGSWYWIIDEIERTGMVPRLVHPRKAKLMMGMVNKTDRLDAWGINRLQQTGTLPTVWIPPMDLRDKRELPRTRMVFAQQRTKLKNRIHSVLDKYGLQGEFTGISDIFGKKGRERIAACMDLLPPETSYTLEMLLRQLDQVENEIKLLEGRMREVFEDSEDLALLMSMPGVGFILAVVILLEVGDVERFPAPDRLAAYAGTTPRVHASGGKVRFGSLRPDTNRYLKWAFSEAGNSVAVNRKTFPQRHVSRLYGRIRQRRGHAKAVGAVARHLAEATYWILKRREPYRDPALKNISSSEA